MIIMEDYQKRVIQEQKELEDKIYKLQEFIISDKFDNIKDKDEKNRLIKQSDIMMKYNKILNERIANF